MSKLFFPNLDALRFFCFLAVFFFHSFHTEYDYIKADELYKIIAFNVFGNGNLGVNFFFVLSGFLITYLLICEKKTSNINIKHFYLRRVLRIWPLFYFCVFFGFVVFPFLKNLFGEVSTETARLSYYLLFINNFDFLKNHPDSSVLGVLWSVAIEEQFYLVWPLILALLPARWYPGAFIAIIGQSIIFRLITTGQPLLHEYHSLSCIGDMASGGLGAWLVIYKETFLIRIKKLSKISIAVIYLLVTIFFLFRSVLLEASPIIVSIERTLIAFTFLLVILEQNYSLNSLFKLSNIKWASLLGKRTYGMYCLHFIGILCATKLTKLLGFNKYLWQVIIVDTSLALIITFMIVEISFRFYEKPFMQLKEKFG